MDLDEARVTLETPSPRRSVLVKLCRKLIAEVEDLRDQVSDWEDKCDNLQEDLDYKARHDSGSGECSNMSSDSDSDAFSDFDPDLIDWRTYAKKLAHKLEQLEDYQEKIEVMLRVTFGLARSAADFSKGMVHDTLGMSEQEHGIIQGVVAEMPGIQVGKERRTRVFEAMEEASKKVKGKGKSKKVRKETKCE